ncbi:MAG: LysE family translocator, partial [Myxococcota bacterium]
RPAASGASGWAAVGAAVLLGLGAGGWLGLGLKGLLAEEPGGAELPPAPAGLLEVADLVFDVAPPGSPASAWFGHGLEGEVR